MERLVEPLMAGIYAADGDQLSLTATFPQLREAERRYGGLIKGVLAARRQVPAPGSAFLTPPMVSTRWSWRWSGGSGTPGRARAPRPGRGRDALWSGFDVRLEAGGSIQADAVIVATPAYAADLLAELDLVLAAELAAIPHASTAIVTLAYRREEISHPLDGHGYVIPRAEGAQFWPVPGLPGNGRDALRRMGAHPCLHRAGGSGGSSRRGRRDAHRPSCEGSLRDSA